MGIFDFFRKKQSLPYVPFEVIETKKGSYDEFHKKLLKNSLILLIVGKRGSGKTAFGMKMLELFRKNTRRKCYAVGYESAKLPWWIKKADTIENIPNNAVALIDEGGVLFSSREAMKSPNKALSRIMAIARHKNLNLILITQSSAMIDLNVLRLADTLLLKEPSLLQSKFERKAIKEMYEKVYPLFKDRKDKNQYTYIWDDEFEGLVNPVCLISGMMGLARALRGFDKSWVNFFISGYQSTGQWTFSCVRYLNCKTKKQLNGKN